MSFNRTSTFNYKPPLLGTIAVSKMTKIAKGANLLKTIATGEKPRQYGAEAGWWAKRGIDTINMLKGMAGIYYISL